MSDFESIEEVNNAFKTGNFNIPESFTVHGLTYRLLKGISYPIDEMLKKRFKLFLIYDIDIASKNSEEFKRIQSDENKKLEELLLEKFSRVEFEKDLMGGAIMVAAYKWTEF